MDLNTLGGRLTKAREKKRLTQFQAADLVDISMRSLQGHEADEHRPSDKTIKRYTHIYNSSRIYLLTGEMDHISEGMPPHQRSILELQDGEGLYGKTRQREVEGTHLTITEFKPKNGRMKGPLRAAMEGLGEIFDSKDPLLIPTIEAVIHAARISAQREYQNNQQARQIKALEDECDEFKKRLEDLERKLEDSPGHGHKEVPTKQKVI